MQKEIETKFLNIDRNDLIERLLTLGFKCDFPETVFFRSIFHLADDPLALKTWARVRDEGNKVIMNVKTAVDMHSPTGTYEAEVIVDNYKKAENFLAALGLLKMQEIENTREQYSKNGILVCIDYYPGIPPYCEIEAPSEEQVKATAQLLGFSWEDSFTAPFPYVCENLLGLPIEDFFKIKSITFANPLNNFKGCLHDIGRDAKCRDHR